MIQLLQTPLGRKAYKETYNATDSDIELLTGGNYSLSNSISEFYGNTINEDSQFIHYYANDPNLPQLES